jgi:hypothetical protein
MADTGPYAHLNKLNDRAKAGVAFKSMPNGEKWPIVPAQDPTSKEWGWVPIDPQGFPKFYPGQNGGDGWKIIDPTDHDALVAAGINATGFPHDYRFRGMAIDHIQNLLKRGTGTIPFPDRRPELDSGPLGGRRGDTNRGAIGPAADINDKPSDLFTIGTATDKKNGGALVQQVTTGTQLFQGPNGGVVDATGWQNGMFDSLGPVLPAPELRLVSSRQQDDLNSSASVRLPVDQSGAAVPNSAVSEATIDPLKLQSIIQAMGSRGLFPIQ